MSKDEEIEPTEVKGYSIIMNAREKLWLEKTISFEQVVVLAFGIFKQNANTSYSVAYSRGEGNKPEGMMIVGDIIKVKDKMIFNVSTTDKS